MITVKINTVDKTNFVDFPSLYVEQNLTSQADLARFKIQKYGSKTLIPNVNDNVEILDGSTKIFGGKIVKIKESPINAVTGLAFDCECADHTFEFDSKLVSKTYESQTVQQIISDIVTNYASGFTTTSVTSTFTISRIVFNQVTPSQCLKRLADILQYHWYIDPNKDIHFFPKFTEYAPFDLTDSEGKHVVSSLIRQIDGTQIANRVKVRGGEYNGNTFTDVITVSGNNSLSFKLPYKFANLTIEVDTGSGYVSKTVGIDFIDDFTTKDVLHNYNDQTIRFNAVLLDGNKIRFSGNPKIPILAIAEDSASVATYGTKEKLIKDSSIEDVTTARKRAQAELDAYKNAISDVDFNTYQSGLRVGMVINLNSSLRNTNTDYIIQRIRFNLFTKDAFSYNVHLVTTKKFGLIELLQKLLEPDPLQANESEVQEDIRTDITDILITEEITLPAAVTDYITLIFTENIYKDPLGAGVEPTWVLAPYFPSSHTDTKREGTLDYSLKVY